MTRVWRRCHDRAARPRTRPDRCPAVPGPSAGSSPRCRRRTESTRGRRSAHDSISTGPAAARTARRTCRPRTRQVREDRIRRDVLEGHRPVEGDRQLHCRQRRATPVEEMVLPADLVLRDAEHLRPGGRQPLLGRRTRRVVARPRRRRALRPAPSAPSCRSCCWPSAAGCSRQWKADGTMYSGSDCAQPVPQDLDVDRPLAGIEGHQVLALVRPARRPPPRRREPQAPATGRSRSRRSRSGSHGS